jgi:signal transduction histidine kinase
MQLSESEVRRIAAFVRTVTKAPAVEAVISEAVETLKAIADFKQVRIVYSLAPSNWKEWRAAKNSVETRAHNEWPAPKKKALTVFFDPENEQAGFVSVKQVGKKGLSALDVLVPELWSALLLQSALTRAQNTARSETELVRETLRARDEERRHIARELHDDLGQSMASLKLSLKWVEDLVRPESRMKAAVKELSRARQNVGVMFDKIRDLSHTLYPQILDTLGLVAAIKELVYQVNQHSAMAVECTSSGKPRTLAKEVHVALYRCCQEAISNAIRHSKASRISVGIRFARAEVRVIVEDNGKGFDPRGLYDANSRMMSSGFWTIRQRMADLGAAFRVSTAKGHGTVVEMIVPYSSRKVHARGKDKTTHRG